MMSYYFNNLKIIRFPIHLYTILRIVAKVVDTLTCTMNFISIEKQSQPHATPGSPHASPFPWGTVFDASYDWLRGLSFPVISVVLTPTEVTILRSDSSL